MATLTTCLPFTMLTFWIMVWKLYALKSWVEQKILQNNFLNFVVEQKIFRGWFNDNLTVVVTT